MRAKGTARCTNCRRLQARVDALEAELASLKQVVAQLGQQLAAARKDSSTSSKPPSSDIVKPPKPPPPEGQDRRRIGGQPGHPKHERAAFPPEAINAGTFDHRLALCPSCGLDLRPTLTIAPRVVQQVDIRGVPLSIQEHRGHPGWCPHCQKVFEAPLPPGIARGGLVGPSLTTLIAYLKGACHASFSTVRKFLRDVVRVTISRGELARIIGSAPVGIAGTGIFFGPTLLGNAPGASAVLNAFRKGAADVAGSGYYKPENLAAMSKYTRQPVDLIKTTDRYDFKPDLRIDRTTLLDMQNEFIRQGILAYKSALPDAKLTAKF